MKRSELEALRLFQLKRLASRLGITGRSKMNKEQLVSAMVGKKVEPAKRLRHRGRAKPAVKAEAKAAERKVSAVKPKPPAKAAPARSERAAAPGFEDVGEVPTQYGVDRLVLLPRDPSWLYAYWEFTDGKVQAALGSLGVGPEKAKRILRVHDVTHVPGAGHGQPHLAGSQDYATIEVAPMADEWYVQVKRPDRLYCVEYLLQAPDGRTVSLARSNTVATPSDRVSEIVEEEWGTGLPGRRRVKRARGPARTKWLVGRKRETLTSPTSGGWPAR